MTEKTKATQKQSSRHWFTSFSSPTALPELTDPPVAVKILICEK